MGKQRREAPNREMEHGPAKYRQVRKEEMIFSHSPVAECRVREAKGEQWVHGTLVHSASATAQVTELGLQLDSLDSSCLPLTQISPGVSERSLDGKEWPDADEPHCSPLHVETLEGSDQRTEIHSGIKYECRCINLHISASLQCIFLLQVYPSPCKEKK